MKQTQLAIMIILIIIIAVFLVMEERKRQHKKSGPPPPADKMYTRGMYMTVNNRQVPVRSRGNFHGQVVYGKSFSHLN